MRSKAELDKGPLACRKLKEASISFTQMPLFRREMLWLFGYLPYFWSLPQRAMQPIRLRLCIENKIPKENVDKSSCAYLLALGTWRLPKS